MAMLTTRRRVAARLAATSSPILPLVASSGGHQIVSGVGGVGEGASGSGTTGLGRRFLTHATDAANCGDCSCGVGRRVSTEVATSSSAASPLVLAPSSTVVPVMSQGTRSSQFRGASFVSFVSFPSAFQQGVSRPRREGSRCTPAALRAPVIGMHPSRSTEAAGGCWGPGGGGGTRHGFGGIFHARVRPKEKITLRAIRAEAKLRKEGVARYNKRWRSWAQNRVRQYQLPLPVTLTSDPALMGPQYITSCVQKAAALRKHDLDLWRGYTKRILELRGELLPDHLGYILWGFGKSSYVDSHFYGELMPVVKQQLPHFQSHALMSLLWCAKRIRWRDQDLLKLAAQQAVDSADALRPSDFIKVANYLACLGLQDAGVRSALSKRAIPKMEETFAQQFRDAVDPGAVGGLWSDEVTVYILERFRRIFITARPQHLMKAYEVAVVCRIQKPEAWQSLSREAKQFYVRLSQRHIADKGREPTSLHLDVSRHLADLGEVHRSTFRWGPFHIDLGLEELDKDERRRCLMVDGPTSFFLGSDQYMPQRKLQHQMLTSLGWDVRRVRWDDWVEFELDAQKKKDFLQTLLSGVKPIGEELTDRRAASPDEVRKKLGKLREVRMQAEAREREAREANKIDFDI
eukprot:TRINITY_DN57552_c0_g1_i1.p1 TRINITY_DN57552_c0_g1~~TRINITY_DN57552_c0_g1_i1.p1  ORF type:complete len:632 (+),score=94.05 TRINITY_DN57552_c0_g1_i1:148-2043(+)